MTHEGNTEQATLKTVLCFIKYKKAEKPLATWNVFKEALPLVDRGAEQVRQASDRILTQKKQKKSLSSTHLVTAIACNNKPGGNPFIII